MSKYTTEVRFICEEQSGLMKSVGYADVGEVIEKARPRIFDFPYPIFDQNYKPVLETKILMHYYTREISEETYGLWKLRLRSKLNEIMPYYNQLYSSELIKFNPLWDTDLLTDRDVRQDNVHEDETVTDNTDKKIIKDKETNSGNDLRTLGGKDVSVTDSVEQNVLGGTDVSAMGGQDVTNVNSNDITNTWDLYSDTPQGSIKGIEGAEDSPSLGDNGYLTNARHVFGDTDGTNSESATDYGRTNTTDYGRTSDTDYDRTDTTEYGKTDNLEYGRVRDFDRKWDDEFDGNVKNDGTATDTIDYLEKVTGYRGRNPSESLLKFRETFLNIDEMIIRDLRVLFFNLW